MYLLDLGYSSACDILTFHFTCFSFVVCSVGHTLRTLRFTRCINVTFITKEGYIAQICVKREYQNAASCGCNVFIQSL